MTTQSSGVTWDFRSALDLIQRLAANDEEPSTTASLEPHNTLATLPERIRIDTKAVFLDHGLGDFTNVWDYLRDPFGVGGGEKQDAYATDGSLANGTGTDLENTHAAKGVRWRDEVDGADLEDNVGPEPFALSAATLRNQKRAQRRQRARERGKAMPDNQPGTTTDDAESDEDLNRIRRSPDRRALLANLVGRPLPKTRPNEPISPPTSPSPPKANTRTPLKNIPVSNPFLWSTPDVTSPSKRVTIVPLESYTEATRKTKLIQRLSKDFPEERKYLSNKGLMEPAFTKLNKSEKGIHVFVDISNISIGFHDCLKSQRNIPISTRVRRIPMSFHNLSLVLERGRPAARRALAGSDKTTTIIEAESLGYGINILERVHKAKQLTPRQQKYAHRSAGTGGNGNTSASGHGETSGSETYAGFSSAGRSSSAMIGPAKWVEQGVDEILHLKMLESVLDNIQPGVMVLVTGDAAEAEYSAGFMRQTERALNRGWMVELVSFRLNTSSAYTRPSFRNKWGSMFRWIQLDDYAEYLIQDKEMEQSQ